MATRGALTQASCASVIIFQDTRDLGPSQQVSGSARAALTTRVWDEEAGVPYSL